MDFCILKTVESGAYQVKKTKTKQKQSLTYTTKAVPYYSKVTVGSYHLKAGITKEDHVACKTMHTSQLARFPQDLSTSLNWKGRGWYL